LTGIVTSYLFEDMSTLASRLEQDLHPLIMYRHEHHALTGEGIMKPYIPYTSIAICLSYIFICLPALYMGLISKHPKMSYFIFYKCSFALAIFFEMLWLAKLLFYQIPIVFFILTMTDELALVISDTVDCCWSIRIPFFNIVARLPPCDGPSCLDDFYGDYFIPTFLVVSGKVLLVIFSLAILFYHHAYSWRRVKDI
jgi:hypothetical protein